MPLAKNSNLTRVIFTITRAQADHVRREAEKNGCSQSKVMRAILKKYKGVA
jgi:hypothetical protein